MIILIEGNEGNDIIYGLGGNDILRGGAGSDIIDGGLGNDILTGDDGIKLLMKIYLFSKGMQVIYLILEKTLLQTFKLV